MQHLQMVRITNFVSQLNTCRAPIRRRRVGVAAEPGRQLPAADESPIDQRSLPITLVIGGAPWGIAKEAPTFKCILSCANRTVGSILIRQQTVLYSIRV